MQNWVKFSMSTFSMLTRPPDRMLIPSVPALTPLMSRLRRTLKLQFTLELLIVTPGVPVPARMDATWPASPPPPSILTPLVRVTAPKPPGSSASISPQSAVLETAPAQVLQGAVRLHGFASSPTPDTQVRDACACACDVIAQKQIAQAIMTKKKYRFIWTPLLVEPAK